MVLAVLLICAVSPYSKVARADSSSWLDWLFTLFSADRVPQRPALTEDDRVAIEKARVLLQDYAPDTNNRIMLGVLAAALGDANEASERFREAHELDESGRSLLPMTMAAQAYMQQGNYDAAKSLHETVVKETQERSSPVSHKVNAYLDLAVACAQLDERDEALAGVEKAEQLIGEGELTPDEKTLAYLQSGVVYKEVINERDAALRVWNKAEELAKSSDSPISARLTVELNLNLLVTLPDNAMNQPVNEYLNNLQQAIERLPEEESRLTTQTRIGEQLVERAVGNNDVPTKEWFSSRAKELLESAWRMNVEGLNAQMIRTKARAVHAARRLAKAENDQESLEELSNEANKLRAAPVIERFIVRPSVRPRGKPVPR